MVRKMNSATRILLSGALIPVAAALLMQCSKKNVPVEELGRARQEIDQATMQEPKDDSLNRLNEARQTLLDAHALLPEEKYAEAADKAVQARKLAMISRLDSAPAYSLTLKEKSASGITRAEEAYAEALAKDDYEASRRLNDEAMQSLNEAEAVEVKPEQHDNPLAENSPALKKLEAYRTAFGKFNASVEASEKARAVALSQKSDMLESAGTVDAMLAKAKEYDIEKVDASGYQEAVSLVQSARDDIAADKLKSANAKIVSAEGKATALLEAARKGKAASLVVDAEKATQSAGASFARASGKMKPADREKNSEYLKASQEALGSSKKNLISEQYEESIQDSHEAIRLAGLVSDASGGKATREAAMETGEETTTATTTTSTGESNVYTVQKTRPAESLWRIAGKESIYGEPKKWKKIYGANKKTIGPNPNLIYPGQKFTIPPKD